MDESRFEDGLENIDEGMMHYPVSEITDTDHSRLGITQDKGLQRLRTISLGSELSEENAQIQAPVFRKLHDFWIQRLVLLGLLISKG